MEENKCPVCGEELPEGMAFCPHCMTRLTQENIIEYKLKKKKSKRILSCTALLCVVTAVSVICVVDFSNESDNDGSYSATEKTSRNGILYATAEDSQPATVSQSAFVSDNNTYNNDTVNNNTTDNNADYQTQGNGVDKFIQAVNDNCNQNNYDYFKVAYSEFSTTDENGMHKISFTDDNYAQITVEFTDDKSTIKIKCSLGDTTESEHIKDIYNCLGQVLFGESLNSSYVSNEEIQINNYKINMYKLQSEYNGTNLSDYYVNASALL